MRRLVRDRRDGGEALARRSLADVFANIRTLGELTGTEAAADALVANLEARVAALRATARATRPRTLIVEWAEPPFTGGHWTPGLVEIAGGESVLGFPGARSQTVTWEAIAAADPDVVILAPCGYDLTQARLAAYELRGNPAWTALRAVREQRAFILDGNSYVNRPGPRLVDTAELFARCMFDEPLPPDAAERLDSEV